VDEWNEKEEKKNSNKIMLYIVMKFDILIIVSL